MSDYTDLMRANFNEENYESALSMLDDHDNEIDGLRAELRRQSQELRRAREALILAERWFDSSRVSHHRECAGASPMMPCDCGVRATMTKITAALNQPAPEKP